MKAVELGSVAISSLFYSCGFIIPTVWGCIYFREGINALHIIGIVLIIISFMVSVEKKEDRLTGKELQIKSVCAEDNPLKLRDFRWEGYWRIELDDVFFNYEGIFGCDGMIPELNARARLFSLFYV